MSASFGSLEMGRNLLHNVAQMPAHDLLVNNDRFSVLCSKDRHARRHWRMDVDQDRFAISLAADDKRGLSGLTCVESAQNIIL